jgi:curved DNA-binding protein CbpA
MDATSEEIKQSYLRLVKNYHPDLNKSPNAEILFKNLLEAYTVLKDSNDRAFYDQIRGINTTADNMNNITTPPGYHMHPAYVKRANYDKKKRVGLYAWLDVIFSRKGMWIVLAAPILSMLYLGASTLAPTKSELYELSLQSGMIDDRNVKYDNVDENTGNVKSYGMNMVPAYWHDKKKIWIRPKTWNNIQEICGNKTLNMVREYKTRDDWIVPDGYEGPETERKLQEVEAKRADLLGIPRKLTDKEKEIIVLDRLKKRNETKQIKLRKRLKKNKKLLKMKKIEEKLKSKKVLEKKRRAFGLAPPPSTGNSK